MNRRIWPHMNDRKTVRLAENNIIGKFLDDKAIRSLILTVWS